jgi:hypothetical protein
MSNSEEKVLGWDDSISDDEQGDFEIAPPGEYTFEIVNLSKERHTPKPDGKLPNCPKAVVTVRVYTSDGEKFEIKHNLFLHSRCEGMLCTFFRSIGHRKHGEVLRPDWTRVIGSKGRCKVAVREYAGNDGTKKKSSDVTFLDPPTNGQQSLAEQAEGTF